MILSLVFAAGLASPAGDFSTAQEALLHGVIRECQHYYSDESGVRDLGQLDAVPDSIKKSLVSHLKARLGDVFYSRLRFRRGLALTFPDAEGSVGGSEPSRTGSTSYHFEFGLSMPEAGLKDYCAAIDLDARGQILSEIDLPDVAHDAKRARIVPVADALQTAELEGVPRERALVELGYEASPDCIVWLISYSEERDGGKTALLTLSINAHNGRKIRWFASDILF